MTDNPQTGIQPEDHVALLERLADSLPGGGHKVELSAVNQRLDLTRFSGGRVHQNVEDSETRVFVRGWSQSGGAGYAITSDSDPDAIDSAVKAALDNAEKGSGPPIDLPEDADFDSNPFASSTAGFGSAQRSDLARDIQENTGEDAVAHGNLRIAVQGHAIANTAGLRASYAATYAALNLVAQAEGRATGYQGAIGRDVSTLPFEKRAQTAAAMATAGQNPVVIKPGRYEIRRH